MELTLIATCGIGIWGLLIAAIIGAVWVVMQDRKGKG